MSWSALKWASETKVGNSTDKLVLIILANFTDAEDTCYPSHRKIAELAECSTDTVIRSLKRLTENKFIESQKRFQLTSKNNQRQTSNIYKLNTPLHIATPPPMQNATPITYHNKKEYLEYIIWKISLYREYYEYKMKRRLKRKVRDDLNLKMKKIWYEFSELFSDQNKSNPWLFQKTLEEEKPKKISFSNSQSKNNILNFRKTVSNIISI